MRQTLAVTSDLRRDWSSLDPLPSPILEETREKNAPWTRWPLHPPPPPPATEIGTAAAGGRRKIWVGSSGRGGGGV